MWTIANLASSPSPRAGRAFAFAGELVRLRELAVSLAWRDVRVRYAQSFLGLGWTLALPVVTGLVFMFVFTRATGNALLEGVEMPYAMYAFVGIVPWTCFASGLSSALNCLAANRNLVTKVYFPREALPLSCVLASLVDLAAGFATLLILAMYMHWQGRWAVCVGWTWAFAPALVLVQAVLMTGLGMLLALTNLLVRDVRQVFGVLLQLAMFVSGVVVPVPRDGSRLSQFLSYNPMVSLLDGYRECLVLARLPETGALVYAATVALATLAFGWWLFRRMSHRFAECI